MPRSVMEAFGDTGDFARQYLLTPTILALLGSVQDTRIMDAGCGQGYLARMLARQGATVVGVEPATPLLAYAREREVQDVLGITYHQADFSTLDYPPYHYDTVVANMVLMDIPDDTAAIAACLHHLHPGGNFVFSISHPCFEAPDQDYAEHGYLTIAEYFSEYPIPQRWGHSVPSAAQPLREHGHSAWWSDPADRRTPT